MDNKKHDGEHEGKEPFYYQNGESDSERLMRTHLNTPGHTITDEDLKNLKVGVNDLTPDEEKFETEEEKDSEEDITDGEVPPSPWGVLGS